MTPKMALKSSDSIRASEPIYISDFVKEKGVEFSCKRYTFSNLKKINKKAENPLK